MHMEISNNFCIDCRKEISCGPRCHSCENRRRCKNLKYRKNLSDKHKKSFTIIDENIMMQFYKAGRSLIAIGEKFNITKPTLSKILIRRFGKRELGNVIIG